MAWGLPFANGVQESEQAGIVQVQAPCILGGFGLRGAIRCSMLSVASL